MALKRLSVSDTFPYGAQRIDRIASSTGIYGKRISGKPNTNAVRIRKGRR